MKWRMLKLKYWHASKIVKVTIKCYSIQIFYKSSNSCFTIWVSAASAQYYGFHLFLTEIRAIRVSNFSQ